MLLQVGTAPNKNLARVTESLCDLHCRFVIVGPLTSADHEHLSKSGIDYTSQVGVSQDDLIRAYIDCDILVFASTYEGFGMPILEANAIGRAVVTSSVTSMPEVAGDAAEFVDPYDINSIRSGIERVLHDSDHRSRLIDRGYLNVKRFQAPAISSMYASIYREIIQGVKR